MEKNQTFRIESLLDQSGEHVSGPMSPMLFAKQVTQVLRTPFNRLARVHFDDPAMLQEREEGYFTGYDHLIIARQMANALWVSFWVDTGNTGIPVAQADQSDREIDLSEAFRSAKFSKKPSEEQIRAIFEAIFQAPECLDIRMPASPLCASLPLRIDQPSLPHE